MLNKDIPSPSIELHEDSPATIMLTQLLQQSINRRVNNIPMLPSRSDDASHHNARVAILFSGGLDCTVLARVIHDSLPLAEGVDLLNVAFENPRVHKAAHGSPYELCPDRVTGRASFAELLSICPGRGWRFVAVNVPYNETLSNRDRVVSLMSPHNTEMDLSISYALFFASRGDGLLSTADGQDLKQYRSTARVLISGLGADELFAGYTRHATAHRRHGVEALLAELDLDVARLGKRNLGRDDRVISCWGKETRFPFLDEDLVTWALKAPVVEKCGFLEEAHGVDDRQVTDSSRLPPEKKVLRCVAWKLGLKDVAKEKKRAVGLDNDQVNAVLTY